MNQQDQPKRQVIRPNTIDWDEMYRQNEAVWSGQVNGSLAVEVEGLTAGRALDVGCGEGADAIWLAERGWDVVAFEISPTAVDRGRTEAELRGLAIDWRAADVVAPRTELGGFDLVSLQYPAFAAERRAEVVQFLTSAVTPGGTLLLVGHAPHANPEDSSFDRADWVTVEDVAADLDGRQDWLVEAHETRLRPGDHHHASPHTHDVVVRAKRVSA